MHALRAFETVARLGSLRAAADELCVTHSAVSHQLKQLQAWLGIELFRRARGRTELTAAGESYKLAVCDAFRRIEIDTKLLRSRRDDRSVRLSVLPLFAVAWLVPRLPDFWSQYPDIDVTVDYSHPPFRLAAGNADLMVRFGQVPHWPECASRVLLNGAAVPVCSPTFLSHAPDEVTPDHILECRILHDGDRSYWVSWLETARLPTAFAERGPVFADANLTLASTLAGEGVALLRRSLLDRQIRAHTLVQVSDVEIESDQSYVLLWPRDTALRRNVLLMQDWLIEQAAAG